MSINPGNYDPKFVECLQHIENVEEARKRMHEEFPQKNYSALSKDEKLDLAAFIYNLFQEAKGDKKLLEAFHEQVEKANYQMGLEQEFRFRKHLSQIQSENA